MTNAAPRVYDVPEISRDHVQVQVVHCLTRGGADVNANVESVGKLVLPPDCLVRHFDSVCGRVLLLSHCLEPAADMPARNEQCVMWRHWETIPQADDEFGFEEDACGIWIAEGATGVAHLKLGKGHLFNVESPW